MSVVRFLATAFAALILAAPALASEGRPPNLVVILADDLGYGDLGCYNAESKIPTPHLDRLARQGMRFTDAHTPASVCTPTRYGILTGRYPWRSALKKGVLWGYSPALIEPGRLTLASLLKGLGYHTAGIGKWHLGLGLDEQTDYAKALKPGPISAGFDTYFGIPASLDMQPYVYVENEGVTAPPTGTIADNGKPGYGGSPFWRGGPIAPDFKHAEVLERCTARAEEVIRRQVGKGPFFLYFALPAPHMPVLPTKAFQGKSGAGPYGDFVAECDDVVGRVLKALDDTKQADDTLVIFTTDNGGYWFPKDIERWGHRSNGRLRGQKADIWEGGHRVPFLARWPGKVPAGATSAETICLTDLVATAAALTGAKLPDDAAEDSFNLLPVLLGKQLDRPLRDVTIHQSGDGTLAIRQGPWRLTPVLGSHGFSNPKTVQAKKGQAPGELFHLGRDPEERDNRWLHEPEVVRRLTDLLDRAQQEGRTRPR